MVVSNSFSSVQSLILASIVLVIIVLFMCQALTRFSYGENKYSVTVPLVNITYPPYPPTITTGKIIIEGTASDDGSRIQNMTAVAHVFPFKGNFPIKLQASPISPNNWSQWIVPLTINSTGTYRIIITAKDDAGNESDAETTINAALPEKATPPSSTTAAATQLRIALVRPTFTEAAYQPHGFYTFYYKYMFPPLGTNITTDLGMLTVRTPPSVAEELQNETSLQHLSNLTALIPSDPDEQKFWSPLTHFVTTNLPNATVTVMRDEDVNDGHIFGPNGMNSYNILILLHNEYVTQQEYDNFKHFVSTGGTILFIDPNVFYAQVRYDKDNHTITLVKGHDWEFDGKAARRSVSERWYNETKEWVGGNFIVNDIHDNITFGNNPFNYTHFEEQFVNNPKDKILIDYGIKFPKDYLQNDSFPADKPTGNITVATYTLHYGNGRIIMMGIYGQNLMNNEAFLKFLQPIIFALEYF